MKDILVAGEIFYKKNTIRKNKKKLSFLYEINKQIYKKKKQSNKQKQNHRREQFHKHFISYDS